MSWREKFEQIHWDHFYILDTDAVGVRQAKAETRVKPAGDEFRRYMLNLCEQVEAEGIADALLKMKEVITNAPN